VLDFEPQKAIKRCVSASRSLTSFSYSTLGELVRRQRPAPMLHQALVLAVRQCKIAAIIGEVLTRYEDRSTGTSPRDTDGKDDAMVITRSQKKYS
jgi:hypothetical protein